MLDVSSLIFLFYQKGEMLDALMTKEEEKGMSCYETMLFLGNPYLTSVGPNSGANRQGASMDRGQLTVFVGSLYDLFFLCGFLLNIISFFYFKVFFYYFRFPILFSFSDKILTGLDFSS